DRFNSMFFAGMPADVAEYIQASSRVGRMHVGFVILIPTPQSKRDRYIVEAHQMYHRFLERMIAAPAFAELKDDQHRGMVGSVPGRAAKLSRQSWLKNQGRHDVTAQSTTLSAS
ncbi:MAG: hypothetical protein K2W80_17735, partial [Burkholderiales bacterium]|nr:hypothetical protein [Burkholderiales bacterium]